MQKQTFAHALLHAANGIHCFFKTERNGKIQLIVAVITLLIAFVVKISAIEWMAIVGCIALVICLEMVNTAIELLCNMVEPNYNTSIKTIKDLAAAAVFCSSIASIIVGGIIFIPKIFIYEK